jgi:hypothetical protein
MSATQTTPFDGPHGSFWVGCEECNGRGWFWDCTEVDNGCETHDCDRCHGNGGYWACVDDLCAALIDEWNE